MAYVAVNCIASFGRSAGIGDTEQCSGRRTRGAENSCTAVDINGTHDD